MVFSSIIFMFTFLPLSLLIYYIMPKGIRNFTLLLISLIFYAWGEPIYVLLMIFTIIFDYIMARLITKSRDNKIKCRTILYLR